MAESRNNIWISKTKQLIVSIFDSIGEDQIHGYDHAMRVYGHAKRAICTTKYKFILTSIEKQSVYLACLLHDIDDEKLFPHHIQKTPTGSYNTYKNALTVLESIKFPLVADVLSMIKLVSFKNNGIGKINIAHPHFLIPRDCDRLEALGLMGIARCISYGYQIHRPLYSSTTHRCHSVNEIKNLSLQLWMCDVEVHTTLDFFIKCLLPRSIMSTNIPYLNDQAQKGEQHLLDLLLLFGKNGILDKNMLLEIVKDDIDAVYLVEKWVV